MQDILVYPNSEDNNNPVIRTVPAGRGKQIVGAHKMEARKKVQMRSTFIMLLIIGIIVYAILASQWLMGIIAAAFVFIALSYSTPREEMLVPKLLVSHDPNTPHRLLMPLAHTRAPCSVTSDTTLSRAVVLRRHPTIVSRAVPSTGHTGCALHR